MQWSEQHPAIQQLQMIAANNEHELSIEMLRPCNIKKPRVFKDGDQWCALLGVNLMEGVCGFGKTPEEACIAFDKEWKGIQ
jgi:hypothetical protein